MIRLNSNVCVDDRGLLLHNAMKKLRSFHLICWSNSARSEIPFGHMCYGSIWFHLVVFKLPDVHGKKGCPEGLYILTLGSENFGVQNVFCFCSNNIKLEICRTASLGYESATNLY